MKMKALSEAVMWLPGFGPGEDPLMLGADRIITEQPTSLHVEIAPAIKAKRVWPKLERHLHDDLSSSELKLQANIDAIKMVKSFAGSDVSLDASQRDTLNRYTGWGGLSWAFGGVAPNQSCRQAAEQVPALLTDAELASARESTINAHFTSVSLVSAVWEGIERLGFKGGRVLDPAAGTGYFIGGMPKELAEKSLVTAVELEPVTAGMLKALYGEFGVKVHNCGFEKTNFPANFFDLVVTNVPFGDYQVAETRSVPFKNFRVHDYFIAKALEVVRPGGIVAVITSAGTLDKENPAVRQYLATQAELVGAFRLPHSAFKQLGNTQVVTDVLFFKKTSQAATEVPEWAIGERFYVAEGDAGASENWRYSNLKAPLNPWFRERRECVLGKINLRSCRYGVELTIESEGDAGSDLSAAIRNLPENVYEASSRSIATKTVSAKHFVDLEGAYIKPGAYILQDGVLMISHGHKLEEVESGMAAAKATRIKNLIPVRDAMRKLVAVQANTEDDAKVEPYRIALNVSYDLFVKKHGFICADLNRRSFREDPDFPLLLSLEKWDDELQTAEKADIFYRRTVGVVRRVERCDEPATALLTCLGESARVVPQRIAQLLETTEQAAMDHLIADGLVYIDPVSGEYVDSSAYLSGNVREKLKVAEAAGDEFKANTEALKAVIPADLAPTDIAARLGVTWVPESDYVAFIKDTIGKDARVSFNSYVGNWVVESPYTYSVEVTQTWGTGRFNAFDLMELAMNQQVPSATDLDPTDPERKKRVVNVEETVAAREKQEKIKEAFEAWLWADDERAQRLARDYNDRYNCMVERKYDGSHLTLPGFSDAYKLHAHQKDAIWRIIASGTNTLLAHCVGAGKTLTMICGAMEMRRIGLSSKPALVVPNHMLEQVAAEFLRAYPGANVLLAGKEDMVPLRRRTLLARIASGDWDAVVLTHSTFEKIELSGDFVTDYIKEIIQEIDAAIAIEDDGSNRRTVKQLEKAKKVWQARLEKKAAASKKDDFLSFDELGITSASIDEAHYFKNLYRQTRLRIAGLPTNDSARSFDMLMKTRFIQKTRGSESGVVFATGTPVANSVAELYTMQFYLQHGTLKANGLHNFDTWAATFGEEVTAMELAPDGGSYRLHTRFARFRNIPELMGFYKEVADIRTADQIKVKVPEAIAETITCKPTDSLVDYVQELVKRAEAIKDGKVKPWEDNMLAVTGDGRKAATDLRLVGINEDAPQSKVNTAVRKLFSVWESTASFKGTQVVFLDLSTPGAGKPWSLYHDMRDKLVALGVPAEEISFVHDAATDKATEAMFKAVREGRIRIIFGSTAKMGVGTNIQTRLVALHDIDAPWRPADVEQRRGRIVRQGNTNESVRIYRYITESSFDAYSWQLLETKQRFIAQVTSGNVSSRVIEDAEMTALSFAEVKALATGNPMIVEKAQVDAEVSRLSMLKVNHDRQNWSNRQALSSLPGEIQKLSEAANRMGELVAMADSELANGFLIEVQGKTYTDRKEGAVALHEAVLMTAPGRKVRMGSFAGYDLIIYGAEKVGKVEVPPAFDLERGDYVYDGGSLLKTPVGMANDLDRAIRRIAEDHDRMVAKIALWKVRLQELTELEVQGFEHQAKLDRLLKRQKEITAALSAPAVAIEASAAPVDDEAALAA